ncbi:MAG: hypothetical protein Q8L14_42685 [Myxococcales bacterium]|nr:hypothetical protein [Myxococcales bacterium]
MLPLLVVTLLAAEGDAPARKVVVPVQASPTAEPGEPAVVSPRLPAATAPGDAPRLHTRLTEKLERMKGQPPPPPSNRKLELVRVVDGEETPVCPLPCDLMVAMPQQEFVVTGPETTTSAKFTLKELARNDRIDATVKAGDRGLWTLGLVSTIIGSLGVATGATLSLVGLARRTDVLTVSGVITLLVGGVMLVLGGPAILNNATIVQSTNG